MDTTRMDGKLARLSKITPWPSLLRLDVRTRRERTHFLACKAVKGIPSAGKPLDASTKAR